MPIYEYLCKKCESDVEILLRNSDEKPECPECGSKRLEKQLSVAASPATQGQLPTAMGESENCGRSQCQSGCMFE
ncbi:MAG: zinc ribbon domain-containing protein [Pirellulaceae bacterium]